MKNSDHGEKESEKMSPALPIKLDCRAGICKSGTWIQIQPWSSDKPTEQLALSIGLSAVAPDLPGKGMMEGRDLRNGDVEEH